MKHNYNTAIDFIFKYEGGYVNHPSDPGGPTNRGITLATARAFWKKDATAEDVKVIPKSVAEDIYRKQYADKISFDTLPSGIDLVAFDAAVLSGPSRATKWLSDSKTIEDYQAKRLSFYRSLKIWPTFGKGWTARIDAGTKLANSLPKTEPKEDTKTSIAIKTIAATAVTTAAASQTPSHWYDQLMTGQALMIGAALVGATIAILYYVHKRYRTYRAIKDISTAANAIKVNSKQGRAVKSK